MSADFEQRDEMYSLSRDGVNLDKSQIGGRAGRLDRSHIFTDDQGGN